MTPSFLARIILVLGLLSPQSLASRGGFNLQTSLRNVGQKVRASLASMAVLGLISTGAPIPSFAADTIAVGKCLLQNCQKELAQCNSLTFSQFIWV